MGRITVGLLVIVFIIAGAMGFGNQWDMTVPSQVAMAILLVAATLWITEAVPLFVTSFIILTLSLVWLQPVMENAGLQASSTLFLSPFFSDIILLFLGGFVLSAALHRFEFDELMARWVMSKTGSSPGKLLMGIMAITALLSMFLSNTATTAMMLALCLPIVNSLPPGDRYRKAILLAVPFAANVGGMGTPIGSPPNAIAIQYMQQINQPVSFGLWMLVGLPLVLIILAIIWLLLMTMYRGQATTIEPEFETKTSRATFRSWYVLIVAAITILGWLTGAMHSLTSGTIALIPILAFFGGRILTVDDLRKLSWDVLLVMGGGLCLGQVIALSGLAEWLIGHVPTQGLSVLTLTIVFGAVACIMSLVMSNTAAANLIMPIVIGLSVSGMSPMLMAVALCCSIAMALPISTPPNAIAFSSDEIVAKDLMKPGIVITLIGVVLIFSIGRWWGDLVGLF